MGRQCIYVFSKDKNTTEIDVFGKKIVDLLHRNKIKIYFSNYCFYNTDSIKIIKIKIMDTIIKSNDNDEIKKYKNLEISNMYLYSKQCEKIDKTNFSMKNTLQLNDFFYDYFPIEDDCLYLSVEEDVMNEFDQISNCTTSFHDIQMNYFPKEIPIYSSLKTLSNKEDLENRMYQMFTTQDMFYNVYNSRKNELSYENIGIESLEIKMIFQNNNKLYLPLKHIFKGLHANKKQCVISYQNQIRMFLNNKEIEKEQEQRQRRENNKEIQYRSWKDYLIKEIYSKLNQTPNTLSIYLKINKELELYININEVGFMIIQCVCKIPIIEEKLNEMLIIHTNELIDSLNISFSSSSFSFRKYIDLKKEMVSKIKWSCKIEITEDISILRKISCISHICTVYYENIYIKRDLIDLYEEIEMRFKHEKNYNEEISQFPLLELYKKESINEIKSFISNYQMDYDEEKQNIELIKKNSIVNKQEIDMKKLDH